MSDQPEYGNAQKMREAVNAVVDVGYPHNFQHEAPHIRGYCYDITRAIAKCLAALSAPPRNCDVGTAEEQLERFMAFCKNYPRCLKCPCCGIVINGHCDFVWGQMLYTKPEDASTGQEEGK